MESLSLVLNLAIVLHGVLFPMITALAQNSLLVQEKP